MAHRNSGRGESRNEEFLAPKQLTSVWTTIRSWMTAGLELRPKALAGLAAIWILIFALHFSTHDDSHLVVNRTSVSKQVMAEVREQRLFFAELAGLKEPRDAEPPKRLLPSPRSERREQVLVMRLGCRDLLFRELGKSFMEEKTKSIWLRESEKPRSVTGNHSGPVPVFVVCFAFCVDSWAVPYEQRRRR